MGRFERRRPKPQVNIDGKLPFKVDKEKTLQFKDKMAELKITPENNFEDPSKMGNAARMLLDGVKKHRVRGRFSLRRFARSKSHVMSLQSVLNCCLLNSEQVYRDKKPLSVDGRYTKRLRIRVGNFQEMFNDYIDAGKINGDKLGHDFVFGPRTARAMAYFIEYLKREQSKPSDAVDNKQKGSDYRASVGLGEDIAAARRPVLTDKQKSDRDKLKKKAKLSEKIRDQFARLRGQMSDELGDSQGADSADEFGHQPDRYEIIGKALRDKDAIRQRKEKSENAHDKLFPLTREASKKIVRELMALKSKGVDANSIKVQVPEGGVNSMTQSVEIRFVYKGKQLKMDVVNDTQSSNFYVDLSIKGLNGWEKSRLQMDVAKTRNNDLAFQLYGVKSSVAAMLKYQEDFYGLG